LGRFPAGGHILEHGFSDLSGDDLLIDQLQQAGQMVCRDR
jgi:hypothetical protein